MAVDYTTPRGQVRLLISDTADSPVFSDDELDVFLSLEGDVVKRAAAQALDTIADDEALTSKVIRTASGTSTDGAKVADSLRKRAATLREQAASEGDDGEGFFDVVDLNGACYSWPPELTELPICWP